ncbi:hypothetical protein D3C87_1648460 [compost metagenome]
MTFHVQLDRRALCHELTQHRGEPEVQQRRGAAQADDTSRFRAILFDHILCRFRLGHHRHAMPVVGLTDVSDLKLPCRALDQPHAQPILQLIDPATQR